MYVDIPYGIIRGLFELPLEYLLQILSWEGKVPRIYEDSRYVFDLLRRENKDFNSSITYGKAVDHFLKKEGKPSPTDYKASRILLYKIFKGRSR